MRKTIQLRSIFFTAVLFPITLLSIENKFEYITPEDGLSQGNIECIFQDRQGFMWFGTFNGLNRYDGYTIKIYNRELDNPNSLSYEHIAEMCEDKYGKIWIATWGGGITVFETNSNTFHRIEFALIQEDTVYLDQMGGITTDPDGNIWATAESQGVFVYTPDMELTKYFTSTHGDPPPLPDAPVWNITADKEGTIWFGIGGDRLGKISHNSDKIQIYRYQDKQVAVDEEIKGIYVDKSGSIWLGSTSQGAFMFDPILETFTNYRKESAEYYISGNTVMCFNEDKDNILYIGVDGGGINMLDRNTGKTSVIQYNLGNPESLNANAVYELFFDRTDNLWVGTYSGGVNFQSRFKNKFKNYAPDPLDINSLSYKNVTAILEDSQGKIWLGTDGGGLNKFDLATDSFTHYRADPTNPEWLQTDVIIHLMQDGQGDIYISSYNHGLTIFNEKDMTWKQYLPDESDPTSIAGIHPWFCFQDSYGITWVGLLSVGLDKFDKETGTFTHYISDVEDPTTLYSPNVKIIYEDTFRDLWIGTEGGGLHKFNRDEENFTRFFYDHDNPQSISNDDVRTIYEDRSGRFWIGTGNGLCLMDREDGTFKTLTVNDGLSGNTMNGILEDDSGNLWISTDAGITKFNPDSMTFRKYDKTDGLQGNEYNYTASLKSSDGHFFFGGKNGFNLFLPGEITDNPFPPPVVITQIEILNESYTAIPIKKGRKTIYESVSSIKELEISYKQNVITFEFAALDYGNSDKNEYRYMLEGFDKTWNYTNANKRFATYTNLPGGDYVFRVLASNGDGVWNEEGIEMELTITPPFWRRLWFILLMIALGVWFVIWFIKNREEKLRRDKEILEQKIQEGLQEVNMQKEEVALKDKALQDKIEAEKLQNWYNNGMIKMSQVMSQKKEDLHMLSQGIITELAEYLNISQGAIFILNDSDENDKHLVLQAAYAPDEKRVEGKRVEMEEGQVGACFTQQEVITVDNLPSDYAILSSGLGEAPLKHLVVIPLKLNEICIGVIELISFQEIETYKIEFVEKAGETLTSILTALKATEKTQSMLDQQKIQAEELSAQEEELRQNLEEMQATQEEASRKAEELIRISKEYEGKEKSYKEKIRKLEKEIAALKKAKK